MILYKNNEGYSDPTAGAAIAHIMHEERKKKKKVISGKAQRRPNSKSCELPARWIHVWSSTSLVIHEANMEDSR